MVVHEVTIDPVDTVGRDLSEPDREVVSLLEVVVEALSPDMMVSKV
jgi:hypothetical protein